MPFSIAQALDLAWRGRGRGRFVPAIMLVSGFGKNDDNRQRWEENKIWFQIQSHFPPNLRDRKSFSPLQSLECLHSLQNQVSVQISSMKRNP